MTKRIYMYLLLLISIVLGLLSLTTPRVKDNELEFSATRAYQDITQIASKPHTVEDHDALQDVREYLVLRLTELGANPIVTTYPVENEFYNITEVNNISASIKGESDSYILLLAHYDSSPAKRIGEEAGSFGAADDGYGISTILEILNVIDQNNITLKNGIKVLFTDAEEIGLVGAYEEVENNPSFFDDISLVINIEARGVKGPVIMFETTPNNTKLMQFFKNANFPVSYSLAGDVYSRMPNITDFTPMKERGIPGFNMAVLDNLDYYHTPLDNIENVDMSSLQHYGEINYNLTKEYVSNSKYSDLDYFKDTSDSSYFTVLPNIFIVYSNSFQVFLVLIVLLLLTINIYFATMDKEISLRRLPKCLGVWFAFLILLLIDGLLLSRILGWIFHVPFNITYMPNIGFNLGFFILIILVDTLAIGYLIKEFVKAKNNQNSLLYGGMLLSTIFMLLFVFVLPGGVYLFMVPLLSTNIILAVNRLLHKYQIGTKRIVQILEMFNIVIPALLFAPILYLLFIALTIGAMGIILLFMIFPLAIVFPTIERIIQN